MSIATKRVLVALWHYQCPECGFGDSELGYHAVTETIWCEICLEEKRHVRLRRWPAEGSGLPPGGTPGRGP